MTRVTGSPVPAAANDLGVTDAVVATPATLRVVVVSCDGGSGARSGFVPLDDLAIRSLGGSVCAPAGAGVVSIVATWTGADGRSHEITGTVEGGAVILEVPVGAAVTLAASWPGGSATMDLVATGETVVGLVVTAAGPAVIAGSIASSGPGVGWLAVGLGGIAAMLAMLPLFLRRRTLI